MSDWKEPILEKIRQVKVEKLGESKVNLSIDGLIFATITTGEDFGTVECPENHIRIES